MGLGIKNPQKQTADICKQHLREKYRDQRGFVEEFILEFEGTRENCDVTRWDRFADIFSTAKCFVFVSAFLAGMLVRKRDEKFGFAAARSASIHRGRTHLVTLSFAFFPMEQRWPPSIRRASNLLGPRPFRNSRCWHGYLTPGFGVTPDAEAAAACSGLFQEFLEQIGLNGSLKTFVESELSALAKQSMVLPDYTNNPKVPTLEEVRDVLVRSL